MSTPAAERRSTAILPRESRPVFDLRAEGTQVVREDRGRTSQGKRHIAGQMFPVQNQIFGQSVKDEVEIDLTDDADFDHAKILS
jgi:hypothetical protein